MPVSAVVTELCWPSGADQERADGSHGHPVAACEAVQGFPAWCRTASPGGQRPARALSGGAGGPAAHHRPELPV